jgi:uncharacterized membrane protein YdjX (TVP38/TMEM64 family)
VVLVVAGRWALRNADLDFSIDRLEDVRTWIASFGWWGPAIFAGLVTFRTFVALTSYAVLPLGGIAFGAVGGTFLGAIGLTLNGLILFGFARVLGSEWVRARWGKPGRVLERRIDRAGPWVIGIVTAHPAGPITAANLAAGVSTLSFPRFVGALLPSTPIRAGAYSVLGASIVTWGAGTSVLVGLGLVAVSLFPLAFPRVRAWVLGREDARVPADDPVDTLG